MPLPKKKISEIKKEKFSLPKLPELSEVEEKASSIEGGQPKEKFRIPKTTFDENGNPICALPDLNTHSLKSEMMKYLPDTGREIVWKKDDKEGKN